MTIGDLVRDDLTGHASHTKVMVLAAAASLIVAFNKAVWSDGHLLSADLMLGLAGAILLLTGSSAGAKYLAAKTGQKTDPEPEEKKP